MGKLASLLRWHTTVLMKDQYGAPIKDENKKPVYVTVRIIGDKDLEDASRQARLDSALMRVKLLTPGSDEYRDQVLPLKEADREFCRQLILAAEGANWTSEAISNTERPDDVKLEDVARDPDAPTLEELEKLDAKNKAQNEEYQKELQKFVNNKQEVLFGELDNMTDEEIREKAADAIVIVSTIEVYLNRLLDEKVWRAVYSDKEMTQNEFKSYEEFAGLNTYVKNFLRETYQKLESGASDVKN